MRGIISWVSGAALAFLLTSGSFLLLANLADDSSEESLSPTPPSPSAGSSLSLELDEDELLEMEQQPGQKLNVLVRNTGKEDLSKINLVLKVFSENTALSEARYYRATVEELPVGDSNNIDFVIDLSPIETAEAETTEPARMIIEARATTPSGVSAVRTAILPV